MTLDVETVLDRTGTSACEAAVLLEGDEEEPPLRN